MLVELIGKVQVSAKPPCQEILTFTWLILTCNRTIWPIARLLKRILIPILNLRMASTPRTQGTRALSQLTSPSRTWRANSRQNTRVILRSQASNSIWKRTNKNKNKKLLLNRMSSLVKPVSVLVNSLINIQRCILLKLLPDLEYLWSSRLRITNN